MSSYGYYGGESLLAVGVLAFLLGLVASSAFIVPRAVNNFATNRTAQYLIENSDGTRELVFIRDTSAPHLYDGQKIVGKYVVTFQPQENK